MAESRNSKVVKYLNLDFDSFNRDVRDFSKIYFPNNSKDLTEASSAQMMIEQASFVGDVLSFYLENRFANTTLTTAKDVTQIYNLCSFLGYSPQGPAPAQGTVDFFLSVPATTGSSGEKIPDMRYAVNFKNVQCQNTNGIMFDALDDVDFRKVNISSSLECRVLSVDGSGVPTKFTLRLPVDVIAGKVATQTSTIGSYQAFKTIEIAEPNVVDVLSVKDSSGQEYYKVDFLAQESIYEGVRNVSDDSDIVPYILKIKSVPFRFKTKVDPTTGKTSLIFGAGKASDVGIAMVPDPADLSIDLRGKLNFSTPFIDPQNFLKTRTLGIAPYNTTLTIKYRTGGGRITNTAPAGLRDVISKEADFSATGLNVQNLNETLSSFTVSNAEFIVGGEEPESIEEIKQNAASSFAAQGRLISRADYVARCLSLPPIFGKIFRVSAVTQADENAGVEIHVIAKNNANQLIVPTTNLKKNLKTYLSKFSRLGQGIDILDGKIINIGIDFSLVVTPGFSKSAVKSEALKQVKDFFLVDNWQLGQAIVIDEIRQILKAIPGVLSIAHLAFTTKANVVDGNQYSSETFAISNATRNNIIFCPSDAIFEVKFPNLDIRAAAL